MNILQAALLGTVEGLTEFLPVSSTGHLILASHFLGVQETDANKAFEVVIQAGAIMAVVWHYRKLLQDLVRGLIQKKSEERTLFFALLVAFLPAAVVGLLVHRQIKDYLFGPKPVIAAMIFGGLAILFIEKKYEESGEDKAVTPKEGFWIGLAQCLALWPGMSRSMTTILGARVVGFNAAAAARFSFLLAIPTLLAATAWDLLKHRHELLATKEALMPLLVGTVVSYVVALVVIRAFLGFLAKHSLAVFGWYRIALGLVLFYLFY